MVEKPRLNLIWYDDKINNPENKYLCSEIEKRFNLFTFNDVEKVLPFLFANQEKNFDLITSGHNGENLCSTIEAISNVNYIIVFCSSVGYHKTWASKFPKIVKVTCDIERGIGELLYHHLMNNQTFDINEVQDVNPNMNMESEE